MCIKQKGGTAIKKKYVLLTAVIVVLVSIAYILFFDKHPFVKSTNLQNGSLAGICLMKQVDMSLLEKELGKLTNDKTYEKGIRGLEFDNPSYYAYIQVDKNNQVIGISIGYSNKTSNTKFTTNRGIGSEFTFSDVLKAYGDNYFKKTYRDFMGSGDGYFITYVDKEQNTSIEFEFNESNPYSDKKEEFLHYITLKKLLD
jgi:hypothetical protein